jgi:protocatechuate 3,4-dioxygenase beta subunit
MGRTPLSKAESASYLGVMDCLQFPCFYISFRAGIVDKGYRVFYYNRGKTICQFRLVLDTYENACEAGFSFDGGTHMHRQGMGKNFISGKRRWILFGGGLVLAAFLAFLTAGASPSEEVTLTLSFRGLKLNALMQWQTVPISGTFEVLSGDIKLGEITANRSQVQRDAGVPESLNISGQDLKPGLSLRPLMESIPETYVCPDIIPVAWKGESSLRADVLAYAREGLFNLSNTLSESGQPLGSASFAVIDANGQTSLFFTTDSEGRYSTLAPLTEGEYILHQTLSPEGTLPAEDVAFDIVPYLGTEDSITSLAVQNASVPVYDRLASSMELETVPAGNLYAKDQIAEFHLSSQTALKNTIPLKEYTVDIGGLVLLDAAGNPLNDQSGKEIKSIAVTPGTKGIQAKVFLFDSHGQPLGGEKQLLPGQKLLLDGQNAASLKIVYSTPDGESIVPEGFVMGDIRLQAGLERRTSDAAIASVARVGITAKQSWQYQYPGRDRTPVIAYGENGSLDLRALVFDSRAVLHISAAADKQGRVTLTVGHEGGPELNGPRLAVKLPDGWRIQDSSFAAPVAAVSHGKQSDIILLTLSGTLSEGQKQTVELNASIGAGDGEGSAWIESAAGVSPTLDNPKGLLVWGERMEGCPVADAAFGLTEPQTYAFSTWTAKNETGTAMSLQPLNYSAGGDTALPENGIGELLFKTGNVPSGTYMLTLPQGIKLQNKPLGQVYVTTDIAPQPGSVWVNAEVFSGTWDQVTALSMIAGGETTLPVQVDMSAGTVQVPTLIQTPQVSGESTNLNVEEGFLSLKVGTTAGLSGRMFDDANQNGRKDDGEEGAEGQLVLWRGSTNVSYYGYTDGQGVFDFSGISADNQTGELYAQLPQNTAIAGQRGAGGLYLAAQTSLNKKDEVQIAFSKMCALYGRIYEQENQAGVAGAEVTLMAGGKAVASATTDAQGQYRFDALTAGDYQLALKLPDALSSQAGFYSGDGYAQAEGLTALLPALTLPYGGEAVQNGFVRRYGSLVIKLQGYAYPLGTATLNLNGSPFKESAPTDDGSYYFDKLFSGAYTLGLQVPQGLAVRGEGMQAWQKGAVSLDAIVPAGGVKQFTLDETVTGRLLVQFTGTGLANTPVTLSGPEDKQEVLDESGRCAFVDLIPGTYQVRALMPKSVLGDQSGVWQMEQTQGNMTASTSVEVSPGQDAELKAAALLQTAAVAGTVFEDADRDGAQGTGEAPLPGAQVDLLMEQNGAWAQVGSVQTGTDGLYSFENLTPGQYRLSIALPQGKALANQQAQETFTLGSGENAQCFVGTVSPAMLEANAFWDSNNDGLQGIYERAIEGTLVEVLPAEGNTDTVVAKAVTDRNGQVSFDSFAPGNYILRFTLPEGYWLSPQGDVSGFKRNTVPMADGRQGVTQPFTLQEGQMAGFGVGGVRTGMISGRIWLDSNENGIMDDSEPGLKDCEVSLTGTHNGQNYSYTTDDTGRYEITARIDTYLYTVKGPEGMSFTRYSAEGGLNRSIITTEGVGAGERQYAIESGTREENQNIGFVPGVILEGVAFMDDNYNGVWDEGEQLLSDVTLELTKAAVEKDLGVVVTGQDGAFRFDSLRGGEYNLRAVLPDTGVVFTCVPVSDADYKNLFVQHTGRRETTVTVSLASGERRDVGVGAVVPGSLAGGVFADANYNGLYDAGEDPVSGVPVMLLDQEGETVASVKTNASGRFAFEDLMPMAYTIAVEKPAGFMFTKLAEGESRSRVQAVEQNEGLTDLIPVALGEQVSGVYAGIILPACVQGQVFADLNDDGLLAQGEGGFEGVQVSLRNESGEVVQSTATNADGAFVFADLHPGRYTLYYMLPEDTVYAVKTAGGSEIAGEDLAASSEAFDLTIGETKQAPLCGAVALGRISGTTFHDTNANGAMEEGEEALSGVNFTLINGATGQEAGNAATGSDGSFLLDRLRPGKYTLNVSLPSGMIFTRAGANILMNPSLEAQESLDIEITMGERLDSRLVGAALPANLKGYVWLDENNNGLQEPEEALLSGLQVQVLDTLTGSVFATLLTDESGAYQVPVILPGTYNLTVLLNDNCIAADTGAGENMFMNGTPGSIVLSGLTLAQGEEIADIRAGVRQYTSISGTVWTDEQGTVLPLAGTQILLYGSNDLQTPLKTILTGEDGSYRFDQLMPGEYRTGVVLPQGYLFVKPNDARLQSGEAVSIVTDITAGLSNALTLSMGQNQEGLNIGAVKTGKLGDFAWLDENANGLQDAGEPGIPGLNVVLVQEGQQVAAAVTDAYGYYLFDNVYPMLSHVQVSMYPELIPATQRTDYPMLVSMLSGFQGDTAYTGDVMVTSGGHNFDCDLGFVIKEGSKRPDAIQSPPAQKWE